MNELQSVPYIVYEQEKIHASRAQRRWFVICIVLIAALIASNLGWIIYESQFETVTETIEEYEYEIQQDSENGNNNFVGHDGDITNGEADG